MAASTCWAPISAIRSSPVPRRRRSASRSALRAAEAREARLEALRSQLTSPNFFHAPLESETGTKAYALIVKLVGGTSGAGVIARAWSVLQWWEVLLVALATLSWVFFGDLLLAMLTVKLQLGAYRQTHDTDQDLQKIFARSVASDKQLAFQLLVVTDRARERWYPESEGLLGPVHWSDSSGQDVHLFLHTPNSRLSNRVPAEILAHLVDLHLGVQAGAPL